MRASLIVPSLFAAAASIGAQAASGRIPIYTTATITSPGKYIVTANLSGPPPLIRVQANDVEIDLNGFRLRASTTAAPVIDVRNVQAFRLFGGSLINGLHGVKLLNVTGGEIRQVFVSEASDDGIRLESSTDLLVRDNVVSAGGIGITLPAGDVPMQANVIGNMVSDAGGGGIRVTGLKAGRVSGNHVRGVGDVGIHILGSSGFELDSNTVLSTGAAGISVTNSDGGRLSANLVRLAGRSGIAIDSASDGLLVLDNTVSGSTEDGIQVSGKRCQLEANHISTSTFRGLHLTSTSDRCVYRSNAGRGGRGMGAACAVAGATNDFCNEGTRNNSEGENYLPSRL